MSGAAVANHDLYRREATAPREPLGDAQIFGGVVAGVIRNSLAHSQDARRRFLEGLWIELKRFGAANVRNIELSRIRGIESVRVEGPVLHHGTLVISALSALLECERIFEFGASDGESAWLLAHNAPTVRIYTFDSESPSLPARHSRFRGTPEESRITQLFGDAATFDFSSYSGTIDLVLINGSHRSGFMRSDTEAAFSMLSELGSIVWYGYTDYPGVYAYLNKLASSLDHPVFHILGTQLALYSRWDIVVPDMTDAASVRQLGGRAGYAASLRGSGEALVDEDCNAPVLASSGGRPL